MIPHSWGRPCSRLQQLNSIGKVHCQCEQEGKKENRLNEWKEIALYEQFVR